MNACVCVNTHINEGAGKIARQYMYNGDGTIVPRFVNHQIVRDFTWYIFSPDMK